MTNRFVDDVPPDKLEKIEAADNMPATIQVFRVSPEQLNELRWPERREDKYLLAVDAYLKENYGWRGTYRRVCRGIRWQLHDLGRRVRFRLNQRFHTRTCWQANTALLNACAWVRRQTIRVSRFFKKGKV